MLDDYYSDRLQATTPDHRNPLELVALETIRVGEDCPMFLNDDRWKTARPELLGPGKPRCAWPVGLSMTQGRLLHSLLKKPLPAIVWPDDRSGAYSVMAVVDAKKGTFALVQWRSASHPSPGQGGSGGEDEFSRAFVPITGDQADRIVLAWNDAVAEADRQAAIETEKVQRVASITSHLSARSLDATSLNGRRNAALRRLLLDVESIRATREVILTEAGFSAAEIAAYLRTIPD